MMNIRQERSVCASGMFNRTLQQERKQSGAQGTLSVELTQFVSCIKSEQGH